MQQWQQSRSVVLVAQYMSNFTVYFCGTVNGCVHSMRVTDEIDAIFFAVQRSLWPNKSKRVQLCIN